MSIISVLAGIIQGEASQPADQFGVASVIQNRLNSGFPGAAQGAYGIATAPRQFSAYPNAMQTPTPYATSLATALVQGNLSQYGNTGNALYYNAPGYAYQDNGSNTYGVGSNVYSDIYQQQPSSGFILPQAGSPTTNTPSDAGSSPSAPSNLGTGTTLQGLQSGGTLTNSGTISTPSLGGAFGGTTMPDTSALADLGETAAPTDITGFNVAGVTPDLGSPVTQAPGALSPYQGGVTQQLPLGVEQAGATVSSGVQGAANNVTKAITGAAQATTATAIGWLQSLESYTSTAFVYGAVVILGVIFVAFGLGLFNKRTLQMVAT